MITIFSVLGIYIRSWTKWLLVLKSISYQKWGSKLIIEFSRKLKNDFKMIFKFYNMRVHHMQWFVHKVRKLTFCNWCSHSRLQRNSKNFILKLLIYLSSSLQQETRKYICLLSFNLCAKEFSEYKILFLLWKKKA